MSVQVLPGLLFAAFTVCATFLIRQEPEPVAHVEPPQRARVTVGDESVDLDVGGAAVKLADGREVRVDLLATRRFVARDQFSFEYPRAWSYSGARGAPTGLLGWWSMSGPGGMVHFQRHDGDALATRDEYASNMEAAGAAARRPCSLELDGRTLEGWEVDTVSGGLFGHPGTRATQQVYGWTGSDGAAWLCVVQRDAADVADEALGADERGAAVRVVLDGPNDVELLGEPQTVDVVLTSFRWTR